MMWEPRTRMIAGLAWVVGLLLIDYITLLLGLAAILLVYIVGIERLTWSTVWHRLSHPLLFIAMIFITLSISNGFPILPETVYFATLVAVRIAIAVLVVCAVMGKLTIHEFIGVMAQTPLPNSYVSIIFLTERYIHLLRKDYRRQGYALKARGFALKTNGFGLQTMGYVMGGLFVKAFNHSEQVFRAMKSRGYEGVISTVTVRRATLMDYMLLLIAIILIALAAVSSHFEYLGGLL